jgi:WD40 repeat protein
MMAGHAPRSVVESVLILALGIFLQVVPGIAQSHVLKFEKEIGTDGERGWMNFVSFSPDGTRVAGGYSITPDDVSGNLTLWSFPDGRLIKRLPVEPSAISRDWKYYASGHVVAEMETGKLIAMGKDVSAVYAFSPDSRYVVESIRSKAAHIRVVELASGKQVSAFGQHDPFSIAISPDGATLASGHWDVIILWNMLTGKRLGAMRGVGRYVWGLTFSPDGRLLAAGTDAGGLQIWDVRSLSRVQSLDIQGGYVSEPEFSPDGRLVAVGVYGTGTAWLIDVSSGKIIDSQKVSDIGCGSVAFSPDGRYLITPSTGGLIKWPYDLGGTIRVFRVTP